MNKEAEEYINSIDSKKIGIISIVGKYRTGKSFLVNRVLLDKKAEGFKVGPTINPCTKVIPSSLTSNPNRDSESEKTR